MSMIGRMSFAGLLLTVSISPVIAQDEPAQGQQGGVVVVQSNVASDESGEVVVGETQAFAFDSGNGPVQIMMAPSMGAGGFAFSTGIGGGPGGPDPLGLLGDQQIRSELGLDDGQWGQIQSIQRDFQKQMQETTRSLMEGGFNPEKAKQMKEQVESVRTQMMGRINEVLLPNQQKRLEQLGRHVALKTSDLGEALFDGPIADALELSDEDRERLRTRSREIQEELEADIKRLQKEAREKLLKELTGSQRETLTELLGSDFEYEPRDIRSEIRRMRDEARRRQRDGEGNTTRAPQGEPD
ncbi:MAG TPA: hypothetical protein DCQ98_15680 [Planctomycetaceae bacterium]|nr:hypothetical protein [Planctomycetaceae bacterium]HRF00420.1 hypothetical protein [Pirellulaceae bacterium]